MNHEEEQALVIAALTHKKARAKLEKMTRALVVRLTALYQGEGVRTSAKRMSDTAMRQFAAVLNDYGNQMTGRKRQPERFAFYFAWWSTRRLEQMLRGGKSGIPSRNLVAKVPVINPRVGP